MRRRGETIQRVESVIAVTSTIGHLRDVADGVELVLKISQRVGAFRVR
ncbi:MAG TPA: hypothetical protein VK208_04110 [Pyrinomonadaceae bacterium]|jgi:hypothetical protein|nr:hypothetical protein [Pyrinomonadaceae bacterium]